MSHRENGCAGDAGRDAGDRRDRHELSTGEMPRAAADRTEEGQLNRTRPTDRVSGREPAARPGTDRRIQTVSRVPADGMDETAGDIHGGRRARAVGGDAGPEPRDARHECAEEALVLREMAAM